MTPRPRSRPTSAALAAALASLAARRAAAAPCDIYAAAGTPCVGAFSMVRALFAAYDGPLYVVRRASDNTTARVSTAGPGGFAAAGAQDAFCAGTACVVWRLVDQSAFNNDLTVAPPGGAARHVDAGVNASALPVRLPDGSRAYAARFEAGANQGYRADITNGVAVGNQAETVYTVAGGDYYNNACCYDFGNAESNNLDTGAGSMEAVYFGTWNATASGWCGGSGPGPWVMADLEDGLWACAGASSVNPATVPMTSTFVLGMVKGFGDVGAPGRWAIKARDAAAAGPLATQFDGPRPAGYYPMRLTGSIILGIGGDNSDGAAGAFFEGVMTRGASTDAADDAVAADVGSVYSRLALL